MNTVKIPRNVPHRSSEKNSVFPAVSLQNKRNGSRSPSSEQDSGDRDPGRILPGGVNHWTLSARGTEPVDITCYN